MLVLGNFGTTSPEAMCTVEAADGWLAIAHIAVGARIAAGSLAGGTATNVLSFHLNCRTFWSTELNDAGFNDARQKNSGRHRCVL